MKGTFNTENLEMTSKLMDKAHKDHMDALWEGREERAERAFREYQRLLKEYNNGSIWTPKF